MIDQRVDIEAFLITGDVQLQDIIREAIVIVYQLSDTGSVMDLWEKASEDMNEPMSYEQFRRMLRHGRVKNGDKYLVSLLPRVLLTLQSKPEAKKVKSVLLPFISGHKNDDGRLSKETESGSLLVRLHRFLDSTFSFFVSLKENRVHQLLILLAVKHEMDQVGASVGTIIYSDQYQGLNRLKDIADTCKIEVHSMAEFIRTDLKFDKILKSIEVDMLAHWLVPGSNIDFGGSWIDSTTNDVDHHEHRCDSLTTSLLEYTFGLEGPRLALVLGQFGQGKTSHLLNFAERLVQDSINDPSRWRIPLILRPEILRSRDPRATIATALASITGPNFSVLADNFLEMGSLVLIIDGIDEDRELADHNVFQENLERFLNACGGKCLTIVGGRLEFFSTLNIQKKVLKSDNYTIKPHVRVYNLKFPDHECIRRIIDISKCGQVGEDLKDKLARDPKLWGLLSRPIFLSIAIRLIKDRDISSHELISTSDPASRLMEKLIDRWSLLEDERAHLSPDRREKRFVAIQLMAILARHSDYSSTSISIDDLSNFCDLLPSNLKAHIDFEAFRAEARLALFLVRTDDYITGLSSYSFSHSPIQEFALAAAFQGYLEHKAGALDSNEYILRDFLGMVQIFGHASQTRQFLEDRCPGAHGLAQKRLLSEIEQLKPEKSETIFEKRADDLFFGGSKPFESSFGPGPNRYLFKNLAIAAGQIGAEFDGGYLVGAFIDNEIGENLLQPMEATNVNLEWSAVPRFASRARTVNNTLTYCPAQNPKEALKYAVRNNLFNDSPFPLFGNEHGAQKRDILEKYGDGDGITEEFVFIPGGTYSIPRSVCGKHGDGIEFTEVKVASFLIQQYPVSKFQYLSFTRCHERFTRENVRRSPKGANPEYLGAWGNKEAEKSTEWLYSPVVQVPWSYASAYAAASGLRLPTEVEWLIAANFNNFGKRFPWGETIDDEHNSYYAITDGYKQNLGEERSTGNLSSVFTKLPAFTKWIKQNSSQLYPADLEMTNWPKHMFGLCKEWVYDRYADTFPYDSPNLITPYNFGVDFDSSDKKWHLIKDPSEARVVRGFSEEHNLKSDDERGQYSRSGLSPKLIEWQLGFRCVRDISLWRHN